MALDDRASPAVLRLGLIEADVAALRAALGPGRHAPIPKVRSDGTHRAEPPETTLVRLLPLLADHGITRVSRITGFDRAGIEVTTAVRPNARALSVANGKGLTLAAARVSAIMEAIERWHGEHPLLPLRFGDRDDVAALGAPAHLDLPRADDDMSGDPGAILWAPGLDLATGEAALVPFDTVDTCWLAARPPSPFFTSTNGLASGSNPVEAALHGLCELVEHDSLALFDRIAPEARAARRIDPETVDDPDAAALLDRLERRDFAIGLWDATSDIGLPVILAALVDERAPRTPAGFGSGCHPDAAVAACRALTEAAQTRLIALTGTRDDLAPALFGGGIGVRFRWALREDEGAPPRPWRPRSLATEDLRADLAASVAAVTAAGPGPVLAVDLSRTPGIAVVRILVPGLEAGTADGARPGPRATRSAEHMQ